MWLFSFPSSTAEKYHLPQCHHPISPVAYMVLCNIRLILDKYQYPRTWLELEITEDALIENIDFMLVSLKALKGLSVKIPIDDFGTGYSSLARIKHLLLDTLKLDIGFIRGLSFDAQAQKEILKDINCGQAQGFLYYKPMNIDQLQDLLDKSSN